MKDSDIWRSHHADDGRQMCRRTDQNRRVVSRNTRRVRVCGRVEERASFARGECRPVGTRGPPRRRREGTIGKPLDPPAPRRHVARAFLVSTPSRSAEELEDAVDVEKSDGESDITYSCDKSQLDLQQVGRRDDAIGMALRWYRSENCGVPPSDASALWHPSKGPFSIPSRYTPSGRLIRVVPL